MSRNTWILFIVIVVVLFGGLIFLSQQNRIDVSSVNVNEFQSASESSGAIGDHVLGQPDTEVILIEYGDFQCPGCASAAEPTKEAVEKYGDNITFIFRNFPLTSIHPNARAAAASAEAAGLMGKYWEMHDKLYTDQSQWSAASSSERDEVFATYASEIGLDREEFRQTLSDNLDQINAKINYDIALARKAGADSTPTFFLNGSKIDQAALDGELVAAGTEGASQVWSDAETFDSLVLQPAYREAGLNPEELSEEPAATSE